MSDGVYGPKTAAAIRQFQATHRVGGEADVASPDTPRTQPSSPPRDLPRDADSVEGAGGGGVPPSDGGGSEVGRSTWAAVMQAADRHWPLPGWGQAGGGGDVAAASVALAVWQRAAGQASRSGRLFSQQ